MSEDQNTEKAVIKQKEIVIGIPEGSTDHRALAKEFQTNEFRVAVFGSARSKPEDKEYQDAFALAQMIANEGIDLVNGAGPGIMEAVSKGHNAGCSLGRDVHTIGLNIELPFEQHPNPYLDYQVTDMTFSKRLDQFMLLSHVFVVAPGGIGTCLELFYTWQLMQVDHICKMPIVMMGSMWQDLLKWVRSGLLDGGYISPEDLYPVVCVDTPDQAMSVIRLAHQNFDEAGPDACVNMKKYAAAVEQLGL